MKPITIRISAERLEEIEEEGEKRGMSKSEIIRERLDERDELLLEREELRDDYDQLRTELETEIERLEQEVERLNREKRLILEQREENRELQEYVEDEKRYRHAGIMTRLKWWLRGMDD